MQILNLADYSKSNIKYTSQDFPDGQQNIVLAVDDRGYCKIDGSTLMHFKVSEHPITIKSRLNNFRDLELICCAVASLRELGVEEIHLYVPFIMGARSDRKFEEGSCNYLKDVICPILNSLNLKSITCLDPHSNCLEMGIKNFKKVDNSGLFRESIRGLYGLAKARKNNDNIILVSPDAGASHKIYKLAQDVDYKGEILTCSKERDKNGKLTQVYVPLNVEKHPFKSDFIIIDDICDGGATFVNIAKHIKNSSYADSRIFLIVTHGIFSKGFDELYKYFDGVYCTNSYSDITKHKRYNYALENGFPDGVKNFVKQLNVF